MTSPLALQCQCYCINGAPLWLPATTHIAICDVPRKHRGLQLLHCCKPSGFDESHGITSRAAVPMLLGACVDPNRVAFLLHDHNYSTTSTSPVGADTPRDCVPNSTWHGLPLPHPQSACHALSLMTCTGGALCQKHRHPLLPQENQYRNLAT